MNPGSSHFFLPLYVPYYIEITKQRHHPSICVQLLASTIAAKQSKKETTEREHPIQNCATTSTNVVSHCEHAKASLSHETLQA